MCVADAAAVSFFPPPFSTGILSMHGANEAYMSVLLVSVSAEFLTRLAASRVAATCVQVFPRLPVLSKEDFVVSTARHLAPKDDRQEFAARAASEERR